MANTITPVVYTDDKGRDYVYGMDSEVFAQVGASTNPKVGGAAATSAQNNPPLPSSVKPRRVYMKNPAGNGRYVVCLEPTADLFTGVETSITLEDSDGVQTVYTRRKAHAEDFGRSRV
jgi:hypothetical protein